MSARLGPPRTGLRRRRRPWSSCDTLAANVPVVVNTLAGYPAGSAGSLRLRLRRQAQDRSARDAADMRAGASLAAAFRASPANIDVTASG